AEPTGSEGIKFVILPRGHVCALRCISRNGASGTFGPAGIEGQGYRGYGNHPKEILFWFHYTIYLVINKHRYCTPSFSRMNSRILRASSSERFWLGMRTKQISSCACSSGSLSIMGSGLVIKFMIHSGRCFSETPAHPGPTSRSSVYLWQLAHFRSAITFPSLAMATSNWSPTSTFLNFPSPRVGS